MATNVEQKWDQIIEDIAEYVVSYNVRECKEAISTAFYSFFDSIGCGFLALKFPECSKLMGPIVPGNVDKNCGCRVPGTSYQLDPVMAAFNIGCMNRWLDFNDTWLASEWGHPSDNLASILACAEYISHQNVSRNKEPLKMIDVLCAMIKSYEIQGILALKNSFNKIGLDHVILVKVASTAVCTQLLGGSKLQIMNAISNAWIDGQALRTYRHFPNTGSRKSWAAGDAASRAVRLSMIAMTGEMGYPSCLTAPKWGFYDVYTNGKPFEVPLPYTSYVMENVLFKVLYPAEFHAQTAVECAVKLHPLVVQNGGIDSIKSIQINTHESAIRIIDKKGFLRNPADRDHCLQYMVAIGLIYGTLNASHYEDQVAIKDTRIDLLREKMKCTENKQFTVDYLDLEKRSIANQIEITFKDDSIASAEIHYPVGHRQRRIEAIPLLKNKFLSSLNSTHFTSSTIESITQVYENQSKFETTSIIDFMKLVSLSINS
ncbi:hypothetical protein DICPUDRAFT_148497 [Dictyostelium purpureum]|uniref:2-methylcitrate dehydratase n=1 Tax=Dictyostelium purpureum TaxID=5786 RepID=F0ZBA0_DICPU|nr:uncharacterized protein DICPUDRAFT_148497 [Dictyostelium purpureum]EGC38783.1 hypothetical protein DICPUDRAFT_148497 [Dictyostelium purpureum]|eukprot:XP_003284677.1 hypothetical protein DICPUDRAFT_148497 [Dictyostelium purpureum]